MKSQHRGDKVTKKIPAYIRLKDPEDVMLYVQRLVNQIRRQGKEMQEIGPITNLLNVMLAAHRRHLEVSVVLEMQEKINLLMREREDMVNVAIKQLETDRP